MDRREFLASLGIVLLPGLQPKLGQRVLRLTENDIGGDGVREFAVPSDYFCVVLALIGNREKQFITGSWVSGENAARLAGAISSRQDSFEWGTTLALFGDSPGEGLQRLVGFLERGGFVLML